MKKLLAAAAAFAALTLATPAQAYVSQADSDTTKAVIQKLRDIGVSVVLPTTCPRGLAGKYEPGTAVLMLCPAATADESLLVETVAHETVHVVQHCVGGTLASTNTNLDTTKYAKNLAAAIGPTKLPHVFKVTDGMRPVAAVHEYEAYALEDRPDIVLRLLNRFCR